MPSNRNLLWMGRQAATIAGGFIVMLAGLSAAPAPSVIGDWQGTVSWFSAENGSRQLQVVVHISQTADGTLAGTLGFPDMGPDTVSLTAVTYKQSAFHFEFQVGGGGRKGGSQGTGEGVLSKYDGTMNKDNSTITGNVVSSHGKMALVLKRVP
jgi:hypothetical protein